MNRAQQDFNRAFGQELLSSLQCPVRRSQRPEAVSVTRRLPHAISHAPHPLVGIRAKAAQRCQWPPAKIHGSWMQDRADTAMALTGKSGPPLASRLRAPTKWAQRACERRGREAG